MIVNVNKLICCESVHTHNVQTCMCAYECTSTCYYTVAITTKVYMYIIKLTTQLIQTKARNENEQRVMELKSELSLSTKQLERIRETEASLRSQLCFVQQVYGQLDHLMHSDILVWLQEVESKETLLSEAEELRRSVTEELRKTREELKVEREKWHLEREALKQVGDCSCCAMCTCVSVVYVYMGIILS